MNPFKAACIKLATDWDYNAKCVKRRKGDGKKLRRYARRKLRTVAKNEQSGAYQYQAEVVRQLELLEEGKIK